MVIKGRSRDTSWWAMTDGEWVCTFRSSMPPIKCVPTPPSLNDPKSLHYHVLVLRRPLLIPILSFRSLIPQTPNFPPLQRPTLRRQCQSKRMDDNIISVRASRCGSPLKPLTLTANNTRRSKNLGRRQRWNTGEAKPQERAFMLNRRERLMAKTPNRSTGSRHKR